MKESSQLIYGIRSVIETITAGKHLEKVFVQKGLKGELVKELLQLTSERTVPVSHVPVEKINQFTRKNHQGVVAFMSPVQYHNLHHVVAEVFESGKTPLFLLLDQITDVRNFGAVCRTAECMGVDAVVIPTRGGAQINPDAVKTSAGALNYIPVCREADLKDAAKYLKDSGLQIVACTEKGKKSLHEADFTGPTVLIMGSEEMGINEDLIRMSDESVKINMTGKIGSLNVSAASAMLLYEVTRQRS